MPIVFDSDAGTVTGLSVGGLPDGIVDAGTLATNSVDSAELIDGAVDASHLASGVGFDPDGAVTINESGADVDFRVEGSGEANALFVQGSDGAVGIGTASPSAPLQIATAPSDTVGTVGFSLKDSGNAIEFGLRLDATSKDLHIDRYYSGTWYNAMSIDRSSGNVGIGVTDPQMLLEIQTTGSTEAQVGISNTGTGAASLYFDASNGDFSGSDYAWIAQNNDLSLEITTGLLSDAPIKFKTNDAEAMRIDSAGNVGLGCTPESGTSGDCVEIDMGLGSISAWKSEGANTSVGLGHNCYKTGGIGSFKAKKSSSGGDYRPSVYEQVYGQHYFKVATSGTADAAIGWTTAMKIDNDGGIHMGTFSATGASKGIYFYALGTDPEIKTSCTDTTNEYHYRFYNPNGQVGAINTDGSSTSFQTSSDYRLKENVVPMTGSIDRLKELKPSKFNFIADADKTVDGFLAHEVSDYVPEAISGEKDAMKTEEYEVEPAVLDDDGEVVTGAVMGEREVIDPQGIDQSKLVPLLTSALQEAVAKIEELTTRIETLENT